MAKFHTEWTVFPHGPVEKIDDGILSVEGEIRMPFGRFPRRMTVVRLSDGREIKALATLHPAYLLRQPVQKRLAWRDFRMLKAALDGGR